ncbi:MAG: hypothetical protein ACI9CF_002053 [Candidatus Omnitrophota bacterium]|jgi:hypothetical protein
MQLITKTTVFLFIRLIPVALVLTLSVFWSNEKNLRLSIERKSEEGIVRLLESEDRVKVLNRELQRVQAKLESAELNVIKAEEQNTKLIQQLGNRDEHIRRLLGEMIQLISGSQNIDLGRIAVKTKPQEWHAVQNELTSLMMAPPLVNNFRGSPQVYIESKASTPMPVSAMMTPSQGITQVQLKSIPMQPKSQISNFGKSRKSSATIKVDSKDTASTPIAQPKLFGEIMVVNEDHNFVVINQGLDNGIKEGMSLWIYRGGKELARLEVETAYKKICAATIVDGNSENLKIGDSIMQNKPILDE